MTPLSDDILIEIFTLLNLTNRTDLVTCLTVSKHFLSIAGPILYKYIILTPGGSPDSTADHSPSAITANGRVNPQTRKRRLLTHAENITLHPHDGVSCQKSPLKFPKLKILQIRFAERRDDVHRSRRTFRICPLVESMKPQSLVLHGIDHLDRYPGCLVDSSPFISTVDNLYFTFHTLMTLTTTELPFGTASKDIKSAYFIMTSPNEPIRPNSAEESQVYRHELIIGVSRLSNYILTLPKIPIHVINLDCSCLAQDTSARPIDKNGMLAMLKNLMMQDLPRISALSFKNGGNREMAAAKVKEDGEEKFKNVTFTGMRDFINSGRWKGVIDDEEIKPWL